MVSVSVIMPVYNTKEKYFRKAIESILKQTFKDFELIIVDDCSDKYIEEIVSSYNDIRIKYYRLNKNLGAASARNFAIQKSNGKYLAFMDSDDISLPNRLLIQYNFLEQNKEIGCIGTCYKIKGKNIKIFGKNIFKHDEIVKYLLFKCCAFCQSTVMLCKDILINNNILYRSEYVPSEDYALWLDLIGKTRFEILKNTLVIYRNHKESISHKMKSIQIETSLKAQIEAIRKNCNIEISILNEIFSICKIKDLEIKDIKKFEQIILNTDITNDSLKQFLRNKTRRIFYHTHGFKKQYYLCHSKLNKLFKFPLYWRIFIFITRMF
ncbi:glycosyltransferase family 2 protein [bacterium]|nr:glycosyltransferase family 2 protein [bacterium]